MIRLISGLEALALSGGSRSRCDIGPQDLSCGAFGERRMQTETLPKKTGQLSVRDVSVVRAKGPIEFRRL